MINNNCISLKYKNINKNIFENFLNASFSSEKNTMKRETLHDKIEKDKDIIFKIYSQKSYFQEILPYLKYQGNYNSIPVQETKNESKKENNFESILQSIGKKNKNHSILLRPNLTKIKKKMNLSTNDSQTIKKKSFIRNLLLKKTPNKRANSLISTKNYQTNEISKKTNISYSKPSNNSLNKNRKLKLIRSNSYMTIMKSKRIDHFNYILDLCKGGISNGEKFDKKFVKYNNKISNYIKKIMTKDSKKVKSFKDMKKIDNDMSDKNNDKYKIQEKNYYNDMKKNLDTKISIVYAYSNRKEFNKMINNKETHEAYDLYLRDINKINQIREEHKEIEQKSIKETISLLEDVNKGKELLKNKSRFS